MYTVKTDSVTHRSQSTHECQERPCRHEAAPISVGSQPIFFFQGDFRTWAQVEARARLQMALAAQSDRYLPRQSQS